MCIYFNENSVLVFKWKAAKQILSIIFHNGKSTFQTNKHFVNKTQSRLQNPLAEETMLVFFARFLSRVTNFIL